MKRPTNVHKFTIAATIVGVLVVAVVGYTLWFVNHSEKVANDAYAKSNNSYTVKPTKNTAATTAQSQQYLTIKEWGVQVPLSAADAGAYYKVDANSMQSGSPTNLTVYSSETDAVVGSGGQSCKGISVAYLVRLPKDDSRWQPSKSIDDGKVSPLFVQRTVIGDYQYAVSTHRQSLPTCLATSDIGSAKELTFSTVASAFQADFKNIQASSQKYLTIKEWGVKVSVGDPALANAIYKAPKTLSDVASGVESVTLATKNTASMDFTCGGAGTGDPITHSTGDDQDALLRAKTAALLSTGSNNPPSTFVHIGSYYYAYQHNTGHGECGITNSTLAAEARAASNAFAQSSIVAE